MPEIPRVEQPAYSGISDAAMRAWSSRSERTTQRRRQPRNQAVGVSTTNDPTLKTTGAPRSARDLASV